MSDNLRFPISNFRSPIVPLRPVSPPTRPPKLQRRVEAAAELEPHRDARVILSRLLVERLDGQDLEAHQIGLRVEIVEERGDLRLGRQHLQLQGGGLLQIVPFAPIVLVGLLALLGFYQIAKHYYFPGWHQPSSIFELMINMDKWNALSDQQQAIIEIVCGDNYRAGLGMGEAAQAKALTELTAKGVTFHRWPEETIEVFRAAWLEVAEEEAAKDEQFRMVLDSFTAFREEYKVWADLGYVR